MPVVLLIRHGENEYVKKGRLAGRLPGVHLNEKGREQAKILAEKLTGAPIKAIYSSPLERTMETAEPIAKALGLEVIPRMGLVEVDVGKWQDKKLKRLSRHKLWRTVQTRPSIMRFPGGESFEEAQHRIYQEIDQLCSQYDAKDMFACVLHSDPIKLAVAYYIGLPIDLFQRLTVAPASISVLFVGKSDSRLLALNYDFSFRLSRP